MVKTRFESSIDRILRELIVQYTVLFLLTTVQ